MKKEEEEETEDRVEDKPFKQNWGQIFKMKLHEMAEERGPYYNALKVFPPGSLIPPIHLGPMSFVDPFGPWRW
jgi:hypothetical protein